MFAHKNVCIFILLLRMYDRRYVGIYIFMYICILMYICIRVNMYDSKYVSVHIC